MAFQKEESELMEVEIKRKIVHALGVYAILLIQIFGRINAALIMLFATVAGFLLAEYRKDRKKYKIIKIKPIDDFEEVVENEFKTVERRNSLPFKGAIEFGLGCFMATILFSETIAIACITVLALSDSTSTLVGYYFGKHKLPVNKKKTWEGSTAFFIISFFILTFFTNPLNAFILSLIVTFVEMLPHFDDNLSIPLALGIAMILLL
jgi:dolichol kinase